MAESAFYKAEVVNPLMLPPDTDIDKVKFIDASTEVLAGEVCLMAVSQKLIPVTVLYRIGNVITVTCEQNFFHTCEVFAEYKKQRLLRSLTSVESMRKKNFKLL